jgi:alkylated DNA repair dioxygenase AlkB
LFLPARAADLESVGTNPGLVLQTLSRQNYLRSSYGRNHTAAIHELNGRNVPRSKQCRMANQLDLFPERPAMPAGFRFRDELISPATERELITYVRELPFREFEFHGFVGKRRTISFGWKYDFSREAVSIAEPMPAFLISLRRTAADFAELREEDLAQTLVTEYSAKAAIGWHRDKGVFGAVVGVSLLSSCQFRLRLKAGESWQRVSINATPRSAYLLSGPARTDWEHSIPEVETLRYSVTFRTLR